MSQTKSRKLSISKKTVFVFKTQQQFMSYTLEVNHTTVGTSVNNPTNTVSTSFLQP